MPEDPGSNSVVDNYYWTIYCQQFVEKSKIKKRPGLAPFLKNLAIYLCLVCYKPMAPLHYRVTTYLVKLWYFKEKTRLIKSIFLFQKT